jgi:2-dehydro-3-deoxygluconokinase
MTMSRTSDLFLSVGECMVELAPQEDGHFALGFAGDTFNTAWYARRCFAPGWRVAYFTAVGTDAISQRMVQFMADSGLDTSLIMRRSDKTVGLYLIELRDGERSFVYWRSDSAARHLADDVEPLGAALAGARLAYLSGITLAILTPTARTGLIAALAAARAAGTRIAFDPNLRPRLWASPQEMRDAIMAGASVADIVLPSFDDERDHFSDAGPRDTAARYAAAGARTVAVKNGSGEVLCWHEATIVRHQPKPVEKVVDSTAAGDSFNAAFLARLMAGAEIGEALAAGAALAGRKIGRRGALVDVSLEQVR